jgi:hypothetical protein
MRPCRSAELDEFRGTVLRVAAILTLRPLLSAAYEEATGAAWTLEELSLATDNPAQAASQLQV